MTSTFSGGRFKAAILSVVKVMFVLLAGALTWFVVVLLCDLMGGPLNVLMVLVFGLFIYGMCACGLCRIESSERQISVVIC